MKLFILSILIVLGSVNKGICQFYKFSRTIMELNLLIPKEKFNIGILDTITRRIPNPSDYIILRIHKSFPPYGPKNEKESLLIFIFSVDSVEFYYKGQPQGQYIGYFEHKKHTVAVWGDESVWDFFSKGGEQKHFDSRSVLPDDYKGPHQNKLHMAAGFIFSKSIYNLIFAGKDMGIY